MPHRPGMRPLEEQVREALDAGITMLQLREKYLSEEDFLREALSIRKLTERYHVPLIINDSLYVAINAAPTASISVKVTCPPARCAPSWDRTRFSA